MPDDSHNKLLSQLKKDDELSLKINEASIGVSISALLTAVVVFFIGLLLTGSPNLQFRLRVPLIYLFLSVFGFFYSALILANASGELARLKKLEFDKQMSVGNIFGEYFGVYFLVFATPIVVLGYSPDRILSLFVLAICLIGFCIYHFLGYSILERYFNKSAFYCITITLVVLSITSFMLFYFEYLGFYYACSALLVMVICVVAVTCLQRKET
jgi:hypothetical protein